LHVAIRRKKLADPIPSKGTKTVGFENLLTAIIPLSLRKDVRREVIGFCRFTLSQIRNRGMFSGRTDLKLNVGCGPNVRDGWINIDMVGQPGVLYWDIRKRLPFDDNSTGLIFVEHVFEHLDHPVDTQLFLAECLRCLRPGGTLRLVVPDAGLYLALYNEVGWDGIIAARPLVREGDFYKDCWLSYRYRTKLEFINAVFRQGGEHKYAYDAETLILLLNEAGFSRVVQQAFGISLSGGTTLDTFTRRTESLYVEGVK
jgi:predicted SAM-dependent methyltransferase